MSVLSLPLAIALLVSANVTSALVFRRSGPRSALALLLALVSLVTPLFTVASPLVLALMVMFGLLAPFRWLDLFRDRSDRPTWMRVWLFASPFDARRVVSIPRTIEWRRWSLALLSAALFVTSFAALAALGSARGAGWSVRWLLGAVLVYVMVDAVTALLVATYHALGLRLPELHRAPILSCSLSEFWAERWNRPVHELLERHFFRPLARRKSARLGIGAAFIASAALHAWLVLVPLRSFWLTLSMTAFFLVQGLLVLAERHLGVARWSAAAGRSWTVAWMLVTTPLFVEPVLHVFEL